MELALNRTTLKMALAGSLVAGLFGCATGNIEATGKTGWNDEGARTLHKQVIINNSSLGSDLLITDLRSVQVGDLMKAQVSLRSASRDSVDIQYSFAWFDLNGMVLGNGTTVWKPLTVYSKEAKTILSVAPDPRGREFKLSIREKED